MNPTYFWILWSFDALVAAVVLYFFFVGLGDGSITSRNLGMWLILVAVAAIAVGGGLWLYSTHRYLLAKAILWLFALPGLAYTLFILVALIARPRWN